MAPVPRRPSVLAQLGRANKLGQQRQRVASGRIYEQHNSWHEFGDPDTGSIIGPGWEQGTRPAQFLLDPAGVVHCRGQIQRIEGEAPDTDFVDLPSDLLPPITKRFVCAASADTVPAGYVLVSVVPGFSAHDPHPFDLMLDDTFTVDLDMVRFVRKGPS